MSCSLTLQIPKALPSLSPSQSTTSLYLTSKLKPIRSTYCSKEHTSISAKPIEFLDLKKTSLAIQVGALVTIINSQPAIAVTGVNEEVDLAWALIQVGIVAFWYFLVMPPIIMNWLRIRWYKRNALEMYVQFMFVFMFFPGIMLWAPFLNFRKFPRDPSMKYPWSTPADPSLIKNDYLKYPFAKPEDYS